MFKFNHILCLIDRDDQFKVPKKDVSLRRLRIESHPTDAHKGLLN